MHNSRFDPGRPRESGFPLGLVEISFGANTGSMKGDKNTSRKQEGIGLTGANPACEQVLDLQA